LSARKRDASHVGGDVNLNLNATMDLAWRTLSSHKFPRIG